MKNIARHLHNDDDNDDYERKKRPIKNFLWIIYDS